MSTADEPTPVLTRKAILDELFHEGDELSPYLVRFFVLLILSAFIAALGLIGDSSAVVIAAMLVAPLMTPILGLAAALVMVWPRRLAHSLALVCAGVVVTVATGWIVGVIATFVQRGVIAVDNGERVFQALPDQLLARTSPTLVDLGVALAAGLVAAYVRVRRSELSVLPGVAIAVALVPPLAAAGLLLFTPTLELALGALLLFATNLGAIVAAAGLTFLVLGFVPRTAWEERRSGVIAGLGAALVAIGILMYPLLSNLRGALDQEFVRRSLSLFVVEEIGRAAGEADIVDTKLYGSSFLTVKITGPTDPGNLDDLAHTISDRLGDRYDVSVTWVDADASRVDNPDN